MFRLILTIHIALTLEFALAQNQKSDFKIYPVDESKADTSLVVFIENLKNISLSKDTARLFKLFDKGIVSSYGGGLVGKKDFIFNWQLNKPDSTGLWKLLVKIIQLGGVFDTMDNKRVFQLPYADANKFFRLKKDTFFEPYSTLVCIDKSVPVYAQPNENSSISKRLSYDIVTLDIEKTQQENNNNRSSDYWDYISTDYGRIKGWVKDKYFWCIAYPRLVIEKINNQWIITSFAPFD